MPAATLDELIAAAQQQPPCPDALCNLAVAIHTAGEVSQALQLLQRAVRLQPAHLRSWLTLGEILLAHREAEAAAECLQQALTIDPGHAVGLVNLAAALRQMGQHQTAQDLLQETVRLHPDLATARFNLGNLLSEQGDFAAAREQYQTALGNHPQPAKVLYNLSTITRFSEEHRQLAPRWVQQAQARCASVDDRIHLAFAQGKLHDDWREPHVAFAHYRRGNELVQTDFDPALHAARLDRVKTSWSSASTTHADRRDESLTPVFLVGMPRSGTTLLETLLVQRAQITSRGEQAALPLTLQTHAQQSSRTDELLAAPLSGSELTQLAREYLQHVTPPVNGTAFIDKLPANFLRVGWIARMFPQAVIVNVQRDPRDVCLSCYFQHFTRRLNFAYRVPHLVAYFRAYEDLMGHWRSLFPGRIIDVAYEQLVEQPEESVQSLIDRAGLLRRENTTQRTEHIISSASHWQARQAVHTRSVRRWEAYREHIPELLAAFGDEAERLSA